MSLSLVKKSLDLVSTEDQSAKQSAKKPVVKNLKFIKKKKQIDGKKSAAATVERIRQQSQKESKIDKVESNVQKLLNLSKTETIHKKLETRLLDKVSKRKKECPEKKQQSAFSEEDFAKFEREYFVDGCY